MNLGLTMTTDDISKNRRPPAGGFELDDDEGQILGIGGLLYLFTNGELVKIGTTSDGLHRPEYSPEDITALDKGERNSHGTPYAMGWA